MAENAQIFYDRVDKLFKHIYCETRSTQRPQKSGQTSFSTAKAVHMINFSATCHQPATFGPKKLVAQRQIICANRRPTKPQQPVKPVSSRPLFSVAPISLVVIFYHLIADFYATRGKKGQDRIRNFQYPVTVNFARINCGQRVLLSALEVSEAWKCFYVEITDYCAAAFLRPKINLLAWIFRFIVFTTNAS